MSYVIYLYIPKTIIRVESSSRSIYIYIFSLVAPRRMTAPPHRATLFLTFLFPVSSLSLLLTQVTGVYTSKKKHQNNRWTRRKNNRARMQKIKKKSSSFFDEKVHATKSHTSPFNYYTNKCGVSISFLLSGDALLLLNINRNIIIIIIIFFKTMKAHVLAGYWLTA